MIVENVWPNRTVTGKTPAFEPYDWVIRANDNVALLGSALKRDTGRTLIELLDMHRISQSNDKAD